MHCEFEQLGPGQVRCVRCGLTVPTPHPPERVHARCRKGGGAGKRPPSLARRAWNLAGSLASFVADGMKLVTAEEYQARLEICDTCPSRRDNGCVECGCNLAIKARGRAFTCPVGKWPAVTEDAADVG